MQYVTLPNGVKMPQLGYGVFQVSPEECERCVLDALKVGYRLIDTAQSYGNEEGVGAAIKKSGIPREELFITTKMWLEWYGYEKTFEAVQESMRKLQTDYLDLVLLHMPYADIYGTWRALEELYDQGKIRAIGISNFYADRMVDLATYARIKPMVNQLEMHPLNQQKEIRKWMDKYNIQIEAWAPIGQGKGNLITNPILNEIGQKYGKSSAQVMLRWHMQNGVIAIPKSSHIERMEENLNIFDFELSGEDMEKIAAMDTATTSFFMHDEPEAVEMFFRLIDEKKKQRAERENKTS